MAKKIENVCGYSCTGCEYHEKECPGCEATKGKPFWTAFVNAESCPVYSCCTTDLVCERFTRFRQPGMSDEQVKTGLAAMERELRARK